MEENEVRICGRKTKTLPTPEMTSSRTKLNSQPCGSTDAADAARPLKPLLIRVYRRLNRPGKDRLEHQKEDHEEDAEADERVQNHAVEPPREAVWPTRHHD